MQGRQQTLFSPQMILEAARPILKWAGGKSSLIPILRELIPDEFRRYSEPFVGGGALFFALALPRSIISDSNPDLVQFYTVVRDDPKQLVEAVLNMPISEDSYYKIRAKSPQGLGVVERAARFVYLNKTCFNGLYRVNRKGQFNTPFGKRTDVTILNKEDLYKASAILKKTEILCANYIDVLQRLKPGDFAYLDPPYLPVGRYADFNRYTQDFFTEADHVRLRDEFKELSARGVKALLSNSYHERIKNLYADFYIAVVSAKRQINCDPTGRGKIRELIIANYPIRITDGIPSHKVYGEQAECTPIHNGSPVTH